MNNKKNNGELTFQSIYAIIKKGALRILIFTLTTALIVGIVGGIAILASRETPSFQAIIEFNYRGIEDGLDPWGRELDVNKLKADKIITKALVDNKFTEEERLHLKSKIKDNISISGVVPQDIIKRKLIINEIAIKNPTYLDQLNDLSYKCSNYIVSLKCTREMKLSNKQCIDILNSIIDYYIADFRKTYGYHNVLGTLIAGRDLKIEEYEYVELFNIYNTQVQDILRFLNTLIEEESTFRSSSSKLTFEDMKSRIESIRDYNIKTLETYIFDKGISREEETTTINVMTYIEEQLDNIEIDIESTEDLLEGIKAAIDDFEPYYNSMYDANGVLLREDLANGEIYQGYHDKLMLYQIQLVEQKNEQKLWEKRRDKFSSATEDYSQEQRQQHREKSDKMLTDINEKLAKEITYINEAVEEFITVEVMKDSINKSVAAVKRPSDKTDIKILILVEVLTVFIAFVIAYAITNKKEKKALQIDISKESSKDE